MEKLTVEEIRTLQLALDNMASDGVLDSGIQKLMALHNKLDRIADAEQSVHPTALCAGHSGGSIAKEGICQECGLPIPRIG